jgi:DNA-binding Xre family transcriptional regulator
MTKLQQLLIDKEMTQRDLQRAILEKQNVFIGDDRISKLVNGVQKNVTMKTAKLVSDTLGVKIDDIVG